MEKDSFQNSDDMLNVNDSDNLNDNVIEGNTKFLLYYIKSS